MHKKLIDIVTKDVTDLFELSEADLFNLKVDFGLEYLRVRFEHDPDIGSMLSSHTNFWNWWNELWAQRDRQLIRQCRKGVTGVIIVRHAPEEWGTPRYDVINKPDRWSYYRAHHSPERITWYPNYTLINSCISNNNAIFNP